MAKPTTELSAQDRVILFCAATGIDHAAIGILAHGMQSMAIRGFIAHNRESGAYALADKGRAVLTAILEKPRLGLHRNNNRDAGARAALIARSTVIKASPICGVAGLPQPDHLWIGAVS
jgi:hypothetical protein